ncbi:sensor domain-containing diguanylate cyclase [Rhizobacter sp. Root1221]|uniref:sensor domain-containing diguanylate cyclase n=1 Tax=Rhizobacter sp. Root1221 TaxID=1736433 RepID=UPI00138EF546|nr:sensor domain-containing diguanylate cyclase [Rhizobacter sp. Root1221]
MVGSLLAALWVALAVFFVVQHERLFDQAFRDLRLVNNAVAQHTSGLFRTIETDLRMLELWMQAHPRTDPLTDPEFATLVAEMDRASQGMINLRLVDENGLAHALRQGPDRAPARVDDRDYFLGSDRGHDAPRSVFIGKPAKSRLTGAWSIPVSWRLEPQVGRYVLVTGVVQLDRLFDQHDRLRHQPDGSVSLVRQDGILLSVTPFDERFLGRDVREALNVPADIAVPPNGRFTSDGRQSDGIPRIGTYERLTNFPVTVVVARSVPAIMAPFYFQLRNVLAASAVVTLAMIAFTTFLHRSQSALRPARKDLQPLGTTDESTGTFNRHAFAHIARREFLRARRFDRPLTMLALDVDHFGDIDDRHGHATSGRVLMECTGRWVHLLREQDVLGRLGEEEFCVLLAETPGNIAQAVAERLRAATAATPMHGGQHVSVSIGLGTATVTDQQWTDTLERADQALDAAKAAGRNRVAVGS